MTQSTQSGAQTDGAIVPTPLYIFDFDGTITTKDTFALFIRYFAGTPRWLWNLLTLSPRFLSYILKLRTRNEVKADVCRKFFADAQLEHLNAAAERFAREVIPLHIRPGALEHVEKKARQEGKTFVVSASIGPYLRAFFRSSGVHGVIATELAHENGRLTGELLGENCWGDGKIRAIEAKMGRNPFVIAEAYGDSEGDKPLLVAAKASFWQPFRL